MLEGLSFTTYSIFKALMQFKFCFMLSCCSCLGNWIVSLNFYSAKRFLRMSYTYWLSQQQQFSFNCLSYDRIMLNKVNSNFDFWNSTLQLISYQEYVQ